MGEISEGLLNGNFDFYTGEYIGNGFGIPITSNKTLPWEKKGVNNIPRKSQDLSWKKVTGFLNSSGIKPNLHPQYLRGYGCKYTGKKPLRKCLL